MSLRLLMIVALCTALQGCGIAAFYCLEKDSDHQHVPVLCDW